MNDGIDPPILHHGYTALYEKKLYYRLQTVVLPHSGCGKVFGGDREVLRNSYHEIYAVPNEGYMFIGWEAKYYDTRGQQYRKTLDYTIKTNPATGEKAYYSTIYMDATCISCICEASFIQIVSSEHLITYFIDSPRKTPPYAQYTVGTGTNIPIPADPTKQGYAFVGWICRAYPGIRPGSIAYTDVEFDAVWDQLFTVTFVIENEQGETESTTVIKGIALGTKLSDIVDRPSPTRDGWAFYGWRNESGSIVDMDVYQILHNETFTAQFVRITHEVSFVVDDTFEIKLVNDGEVVEVPEDPVKEGYKFIKWENTDGKLLTDPVVEDLIFTAIFEEI